MKELYLYSGMYSDAISELMAKIHENMGEEITLRTLTPGGSVYASMGLYSKMKEHGQINLKIDGACMSAGTLLPLFANYTECLDVTRFMFHRADMFVSNDQEQEELDKLNKDLKALMKKKLDLNAWKEETGITVDELFDPEQRKDIYLSGAQAKKIGLVDKVVKLTPKMEKEMSSMNEKFMVAMSATPNTTTSTTKKIMTVAELKINHPELFQSIKAEGAAEERDRVNGWNHFMEADPKAVKEGIDSGKVITQAQAFELMEKRFTKKDVAKLEDESEKKPLQTGKTEEKPVEKSKEEKTMEDFVKNVTQNSNFLSSIK